MSTISVFVTLGDDEAVIFYVTPDAFVGDLIKMVITELAMKVTPCKVRLRFASSGMGEAVEAPLKSSVRLTAAGVHEGCRLIIEVKTSHNPDGAFMKGGSLPLYFGRFVVFDLEGKPLEHICWNSVWSCLRS